MGTMIKTVVIFLLLCSYFGCSPGIEKTQYIAIKDGKKLQPHAKVVYKVSADRQEVVYWVETPGKSRSQLYKLKKCIIADVNNWEGEADYILLWKVKVNVVNGEFSTIGAGLANVSWWAWHFKTDPKPSNLMTVVGGGVAILMILGIVLIMEAINRRQKSRKKRELNLD